MITIETFTFNDFHENTYLLFDETKECVIVDPGCYSASEQAEVKSFIENNRLKPLRLINTHCHIDHVLGNNFVAKNWSLDLEIHRLDLPTLYAVREYCQLYGFGNYEASPEPVHFLEEGDVISFGNSKLTVLFTPGHAPGHIILYSEKYHFIIGGDVLFQNSIGRTDLAGGDYDTLIKSIKEKLLTLDAQTKVYCGHGPSTYIGYEKNNNPFLK